MRVVPHKRCAFAGHGGDAVHISGRGGGGDRRADMAPACGGGERVGLDSFRRRRRARRRAWLLESHGLRFVRVRRGGVRGSVPGRQLRFAGRRAGRDADPGPDPFPVAQRRGVPRRAGRGDHELLRDDRSAARKAHIAESVRRGAGSARADVRAVRRRAAQLRSRGRDVHVSPVPGGGDHRPRDGRGGGAAFARRRHRAHRVVREMRVRREAVRALRSRRGRARAVYAGGARVHQHVARRRRKPSRGGRQRGSR